MGYNPETCITAGQLRDMGFPILDSIPDCGWVPRASVRVNLGGSRRWVDPDDPTVVRFATDGGLFGAVSMDSLPRSDAFGGAMTRSPFELIPIGPPCEDPECKGVLQDHIQWTEPRECYRKCSECGKEYGRMSLTDKMGWAVRTIKRAMVGMKSD